MSEKEYSDIDQMKITKTKRKPPKPRLKSRRFTPGQEEDIIAMYQKGGTVKDIITKYKMKWRLLYTIEYNTY